MTKEQFDELILNNKTTEFQLRTLTGIIYIIISLSDYKAYVGQTINRFCDRYKNCKWYKTSSSIYLKNAVNKYGIENFIILILQSNKNINELNYYEDFYANKYNCYVPNGYNLTKCGENKIQSVETIEKRSRKIILNNPDGNDIKITNIRQFCIKNNLDSKSIYGVLSGKFNSHKGWTLSGNKYKTHKNKKPYKFYDKNNNLIEIIGLIDFCKNNNLNYNSMRDMLQGKTYQYLGFTLKPENILKRKKKYKILLENGDNIIEINNIKEECHFYGLHSRYIYHLINKKLNTYKGWKLKELIYS